jgi:hypothetical protein
MVSKSDAYPSGWIFASEQDANRPMDRHLFDNWLRRAETTAGLKKLIRLFRATWSGHTDGSRYRKTVCRNNEASSYTPRTLLSSDSTPSK